MDLFLNRTLGKIRLHRQVISEAKQIWSAISWVDKLHSWCSWGRLWALAEERHSSEHPAVWLLLSRDFHRTFWPLRRKGGRWTPFLHRLAEGIVTSSVESKIAFLETPKHLFRKQRQVAAPIWPPAVQSCRSGLTTRLQDLPKGWSRKREGLRPH